MVMESFKLKVLNPAIDAVSADVDAVVTYMIRDRKLGPADKLTLKFSFDARRLSNGILCQDTVDTSID